MEKADERTLTEQIPDSAHAKALRRRSFPMLQIYFFLAVTYANTALGYYK